MSNHEIIDDLLPIIEDYLSKSELAASAFGKEITGSPNFVFDLKAGKGYHSKTRAKVLSFIRDNPPKAEAAE